MKSESPTIRRIIKYQTGALREKARGNPPFAGLILVLLIATSIVFYWAIFADNSPAWTGFGAYDEESSGPRAKTLWDWLELLIVPAVLALAALVFNRSQKATELKIAAEAREAEQKISESRQMQTTLEAYYDRMTDLLLSFDLRDADRSSEKRALARARTLETLRSLDGHRKGQLLRFLHQANLIRVQDPLVRLEDADLSGAQLDSADLADADLTRVNFRNANLNAVRFSGARLKETDFRGAILNPLMLHMETVDRVNFEDADLEHMQIYTSTFYNTRFARANLSHARLERGNMRNADLKDANLGFGWLVELDLSEACLVGASLESSGLRFSKLDGADLNGTNLLNTDFMGTSLKDVKNWSLNQLSQASNVEDMIVPDGTKLGRYDQKIQMFVDGPSFADWKTQYLATHGGTETDLRDPSP